MKQKRLATRQKIKTPLKMPRRASLFWDADTKDIDSKKHARYIIERILDFGNDKEVAWLWNTYPKSLVRDVVRKSRVLHGPTRALWQALTTTQK